VFVQQEVTKPARTLIEFPPMQAGASVNMSAVKEAIDKAISARAVVYSPLLGRLSGESITVLGSQSNEEGVIVKSRINGVVPMGVDWQLNPTSNGYKVTDLFVAGINMDLAALRGGLSHPA
jgi:ABC-type transporter MlaC component